MALSRMVVFYLLLGAVMSRAQSDWATPEVASVLDDTRSRLLKGQGFVAGVALNVSVEFGLANNSQFRLSLSGAVSRGVLRRESELNAAPAVANLQSELLLFRGGLGATMSNKERARLNLEWRNQFTVAVGYAENRAGRFLNPVAGKPLTVFLGNSNPALFDPFDVSLVVGSTFVNGINVPQKQQIGGLSLGLYNVQVSYCNDGPIYNWFFMPTGDAYDRWWTGGGRIGYYNASDLTFFTSLELRYDKFTGYQPNAYELASRLGLNFIPYKNKREALKNQGRYSLLAGIRNRMLVGVNLYDPRMVDFQNMIHTIGRMPFHQTNLKQRIGVQYDYRLSNFFHF
jgi:hypothetical protein